MTKLEFLSTESDDSVIKRKMSDEQIDVPASNKDLLNSTMRRVSWRILPLFCVYIFVGQSEKKNLAYASQGLKDSLGISDRQYGLVASSFVIAYAAFIIPNTLLAKRVGVKLILTAMMYGFGIVTMCTGFVTNYASLIILRVLLGITESGGIQIVLYHLSLFFGPERFTQAMSRSLNLGGGLSSICSGPIAAAILAASKGSSLASWRWLFIIESLPCFVIATVVLLFLPDSPIRCGKLLRGNQHDCLIKYTTALQEEKSRISSDLAEQSISFWRVLRDPRVILLGFTSFCWEFCGWGIMFW